MVEIGMSSLPPLVLLHGWGMTPAVWDGFAPALRERFAVSAPPLPCHPGSEVTTGALPAWADAIAGGLPDDALVCGWSLGAQLAMTLALRHPHKVRRLLLVGATPCFVAAPGWGAALDAATVTAFVEGFRASPAPTLRRFLSLQVQGEARRKPVLQALGATAVAADALEAGDAAALAAALDVLVSTDLRALAGGITAPTLLLHGDGDALMPLDAAHWLAEALPHARLEVFADSGHAPFLSDPERFVALLGALGDA